MFEKEALKIWISFIKKRWFRYLVGAIAVFLTNAMQILAPKNIGWIIDFFTSKNIPTIFYAETKEGTFFRLFIVLILSRVFINVFRFLWRITLGRQTHYACGVLREEVWEHVRYFKRLDLNTKFSKGVLMNAEVSDANSARFIFGFTLVAIFDLIFLGISTFIVMGMIHFKMALLAFSILLFVPLLVRRLSKLEVDQFKITQDALSSFNDLSSQAVATIKLQRLTQTGDIWEKRLTEIAHQHRKNRLKGLFLNLKYIPLMGAATLFSYALLFGLGIYYTVNGQMSVGEFVSMQGLIFLLHDPLMTFGFVISEWKKAFTALTRLAEVFTNEKDQSLLISGNEIISSELVFDVKNLNFSYEGLETKIIDELNLKIEKNMKLGILGPIGSGKSTLISILAGLERNHSGEVLFYGKQFSHYSHNDLRDHIVVVHQKPFLFADSIRMNVALDLEISDDEIWRALEIADLKSDVMNFENKLDTELGEWGINLSGGQKQRLTLARAIIRRPKVLFLDDCLSAVDTITEEKILKNLESSLNDVTMIWVAHRASTLKYCHKTMHLGQIGEH